MSFHAVKEAGVVDTLSDAGKFIFDEHPLPTYRPTHPGTQAPNWFDKINPLGTDKGVQKGYEPGRIGRWLGARGVGPHSIIGQPTAGYGEGFANKAKTFGHTIAEFGRSEAFGNPLAVDRQLRAPTAAGVGRNYLGMAKNFYMPSGRSKLESAAGLGMGLAMPAISLYGAATGDPNQRGANIGATLGGLAVAPVTSRLGMPGMLLQHPVQQLGAWVGSKFDPKPEAPKVANLVGSLMQTVKDHPVSSALVSAAALKGAHKLVSTEPQALTYDPMVTPQISHQQNNINAFYAPTLPERTT